MTTRLRIVAAALTLAVASRGAVAQPKPAPDKWTDPTKHKTGFVNVTPAVRIHYLDFGGSGPTVLFLPGLGNTAHAFDNFAPALTDRYHVVAMTRRGFGESSHPDSGYDTPRLVEDIRAVVRRLHLGRVILIGHSIAGEEMSLLASTHPDEVSKLVYLDAAYDRVLGDSLITETFTTPPDVPAPPEPTDADTATPAAYVDYVHRTRGVNIPESDIRARYKYDGWDEEVTLAYQSIGVMHPNYKGIRAPALAIYAVTDTVTQLEPWQRTDTAHFAGLMDMIRGTESVVKQLRAQFKRQVAHSGVIEIHGGHHWIFVSHRDEVLADVRRFLALP
ncbi:MAG: alpha/beta fold hydrolase [Gemmatimonadaceae bacterium]